MYCCSRFSKPLTLLIGMFIVVECAGNYWNAWPGYPQVVECDNTCPCCRVLVASDPHCVEMKQFGTTCTEALTRICRSL